MNPIDALMHKCQQQEAEIQRLKAQLELQPCGHPVACIVQGEQVGPGEFVHYCGWCQSLDVARWQTEHAILGSLHVLAKGELDRIEQHGGTTAFAERVLALAEEGLT